MLRIHGRVLDKTDMKLLYYLSQNCRLSYSSLASNVGVSRDAVRGRIGRLVKDGTILSFAGVFAAPNMGLEFYIVYLSFLRLDADKHALIENYFRRHKNAMWINKTLGVWNYALILTIRGDLELLSVLSDFREKFRGLVKDIEFEHVLYEYKYRSLVPEVFRGVEIAPFVQKKEDSSFLRLLQRHAVELGKVHGKEKVDYADVRLLEALSEDSRASLQALSGRLSMSPENVRYRIKRLIEKKIVGGFWAAVNYDLLGYNWYRVRLRLGKADEKGEKRLAKYIANHPSIFWSGRLLGRFDLHVDLRLRNNSELDDFLSGFNSEFSDMVSEYETLIMTQGLTHNNFSKVMYELAAK